MKRDASLIYLRSLERKSAGERGETPPPLSSAKISVKLFFRERVTIDPHVLVPILRRWVRERTFAGERLVDVVGYTHETHGPWVMLVGTGALWIVDSKHGRPGLRFTRRRTAREGFGRLSARTTPRAALRAAYAGALTAARLLTIDTGIAFSSSELEVEIADRLLAPNTPETYARAEPDLRAFGREVFESPKLLPVSAADPSALFRVSIEGQRKARIDALLDELDGLSKGT
ncbi:hypothetical protein L6R52_19025 [Myxococcota bacterium]|nr:hypothetical protein [Myxococcota bacterium]